MLPIGAVGELLIEGPTVGRGYLNNPEKTAAAFIAPPSWLKDFRHGVSGSLYKTGDLVQYAGDGSVRYFRRKDSQVKLRGQRLELGEVEHHVQQCFSATKEVVAEVVVPAEQGRAPYLTAYILHNEVPEYNQMAIDDIFAIPSKEFQANTATAESILNNSVPLYMVPSAYVPLSYVPMTPSGKIDRRRLCDCAAKLSREQLALCTASSLGGQAPSNEVESTLCLVWAWALNIALESIGVEDSFFRLGGDSIAAMQVSAQSRAVGLVITVSDIFRCKTIAQLAVIAKPEKQQISISTDEQIDTWFELSPIQQFIFELDPQGHHHFNQSFTLRVAEGVEAARIVQAVETLVHQHSMLRARFSRDEHGRWMQIVTNNVKDSYRYCEHRVGDARDFTGIMMDTHKSLNFETGPLFAVDLIEESKGRILYLVAHHFVIDLVSWRVLLEDLEEFLRAGTSSQIKTLPFQTWCRLQGEYAAKHLSPEKAFPSNIRPMPERYWGENTLNRNTYGDTLEAEFATDEQKTAILLGRANEAFGSRPVEIFQAAVLHFQSDIS